MRDGSLPSCLNGAFPPHHIPLRASPSTRLRLLLLPLKSSTVPFDVETKGTLQDERRCCRQHHWHCTASRVPGCLGGTRRQGAWAVGDGDGEDSSTIILRIGVGGRKGLIKPVSILEEGKLVSRSSWRRNAASMDPSIWLWAEGRGLEPVCDLAVL